MNRGPLGFKRITDKGPLVKSENDIPGSLDEIFGGIPGGGGFDSRTEYEIGAQRIAEACHCILGSLTKVKRRSEYWEKMGLSYEESHIMEELSIIKKSVEEYARDVYVKQLNERHDNKYVISMMNELPIISRNLIILASEKKKNLNPNNEICVLNVAKYTYDVLINLGMAMKESVKYGIPTYSDNAFRNQILILSINDLEDIIINCLYEVDLSPELKMFIRDLIKGPYWDDPYHPIYVARNYKSPNEFIEDTRPKDIMNINKINTEFNKPAYHDETVESMVESIYSMNELPPIMVSPEGYLQDGRHRLRAYMEVGEKNIHVVYGIGPGSVQAKEFNMMMTKIWEAANLQP